MPPIFPSKHYLDASLVFKKLRRGSVLAVVSFRLDDALHIRQRGGGYYSRWTACVCRTSSFARVVVRAVVPFGRRLLSGRETAWL